ncbi:MAG: aa3-type cytochrome c oxidase subunit IV [Novosphingobium sp.]
MRRHWTGNGHMASGNDIKSHTSTYSGFIGLLKWGTIISVLTAALVVLIIA